MHVTDDRGHRVKLIPKHQLSTLPGVQSPVPMIVRQALNTDSRHLFDSTETLACVVMGGFGSALLCIAVSFFAWPLIFVVGPLPFLLGNGALFILCVTVITWLSVRSAHRRAVQIITDQGVCPSCGYSLHHLAPAADGCTICPECGSAWRIPAAKDV